MLILKVELAPRGDLRNTKTLGQLVITNDQTGGDISNYDLNLSEWGRPEASRRQGKLLSHDRNKGGWHLIKDALNAILAGVPR